MSNWWLRVPLLNLPLPGEFDVEGVQLRPRMNVATAERKISAAQYDVERFVHTADALIRGEGSAPGRILRAKELLSPRIGHIVAALSFVYSRDICGRHAYLQSSPDEDATADKCYDLGGLLLVPKGRVLRVDGAWDLLLRLATSAWLDDALNERTGFQFAAAFQQYWFIPGLPLEHGFLHQWVALEAVVNRWCEANAEAPECVRDKPERKPAAMKLRAFLRWMGAFDDLQTWSEADLNTWCEETGHIRNSLMHHGPAWRERYPDLKRSLGNSPSEDLLARARQIRMLVDRFIMVLLGYEPREWPFEQAPEECPVFVQRPEHPGEGAGATTATADDNDRAGM
jgi:hypothetical protein